MAVPSQDRAEYCRSKVRQAAPCGEAGQHAFSGTTPVGGNSPAACGSPVGPPQAMARGLSVPARHQLRSPPQRNQQLSDVTDLWND
jgi:hypothetical protein